MSKPIFLTKEYVDAMVEEFRRNVSEAKMTDGKIAFSKSFDYTGADDTKAHIIFKPVAYIKMLALLRHFDSEVAWHGTVQRDGEDKFIITDIIVYPQEVTGSTVNTDQEEYQRWTMALDDEYFNSMRMQGHSHVNMSTTPSSVDANHQQQILAQLKGDDYYIFMVFNKRLEHTIKIYDYANNVMYEDKDVVVNVADEGFNDASFIAAANKSVKRKTYSATIGSYEGHEDCFHNYESRPYTYASRHGDAAEEKTEKRPAKRPSGKSGTKAEEKGKDKRGRGAKSESGAYSQMRLADLEAYPRGGKGIKDWDREIFGDSRSDD